MLNLILNYAPIFKNSKMRISFIIIIVAFLHGSTLSQEWNIYSNIDSLGNIIKSYHYITENEIKEKFNVYNFNIEKLSLENMCLLPLQLVSRDQIRLERVPFYEDQLSDVSELYFIGKIAIKDAKLSHYLFANIVNNIYTKYFMFNYYSGEITSVIEFCSKTTNIDFPEFSYRLSSYIVHSERKIILNYDYDDNIFNQTKMVSISDKGLIRIIE
ncbi:MAG: hypothetical protein IPM42_11840 [Saprospiraceae bacterium]|nr:hypothetical protein [Saprospiraceae bacterium]